MAKSSSGPGCGRLFIFCAAFIGVLLLAASGARAAASPVEQIANYSGAAALVKSSPHLHAGMLMVDYLLSQKGQEIRQSRGYATARRDMQNPEKPDKIYYLSERSNDAAEVEAWGGLIRQFFGKVGAPPAGFVDSGED